MAKLTAKTRAKIPSGKFALPGRRFPIEDKSHAQAALRMAPKSRNAGNISPMQEAMVERKARSFLRKGK